MSPPPLLPGLRLPLGRRRFGPGAAVAVFMHAVIVGAPVIRGREILGRGQGGSRAPGATRANFFAIPAGAPAASGMGPPPPPTLSALPAVPRIPRGLTPPEPPP